MTKRILALIALVILVLNVSSCSGKKRYEAQFLMLFDTVTTIVGYSESKEEFERFSQLLYDTLKEYHELYDIYNSYEGKNNIKTINDNAGLMPVKVDKKIIDLLVFAKEQYQQTNGRMNIAFGSVLKIWRRYRTEGTEDFENAKLPKSDELKEAAKHTDINKIVIDETHSTVFLEDPDMSIDVGSVAKGYATEKVCTAAEENGFSSGLVSVGGNVRAIGNKDGDLPWNVGVQNPDTKSGQTSLKTVYLSDASLVTSGVYQRTYTVDGKSYHHIIDPDTLFPTEYFASVTIACKDSGMADVLSTAVFNMPFETGMAFVDSLEGVGALWVFHDGEIKYSKGFERYLNS